MKQYIIYTDAKTGDFCQVSYAKKTDLERIFGPTDDATYEAYIWSKIPKDAIGARDVDLDELHEILKGLENGQQ